MNKGIWLKREYLQSGIIDTWFHCSECDFESGQIKDNYKYCPVCGSRMFFSVDEMIESNIKEIEE